MGTGCSSCLKGDESVIVQPDMVRKHLIWCLFQLRQPLFIQC